MQIELDHRSKIPSYVQIIDQIKHLIAIGALRPDDQLPTVRQLAADLRLNFNTIARAYRALDEEGLISTQHGRGTFILAIPNAKNGETLRQLSLEWLTRHYLNEAVVLGYSPVDVKEIFETNLKIWEQTGSPPTEHEAED
jgi:GntR family transcriptional regulator